MEPKNEDECGVRMEGEKELGAQESGFSFSTKRFDEKGEDRKPRVGPRSVGAGRMLG